MHHLTTLPDEIRLGIFEYIFCDLRISLKEEHLYPRRKRRNKSSVDTVTADEYKSSTFAIFLASKSFAQDPILHKALRSAATIHFPTIQSIQDFYNAYDSQIGLTDLRHFSIEWKPRSVCPTGRTGKALDATVRDLKSKFPGFQTLEITNDKFRLTLFYAALEDMSMISDIADAQGISTRFKDDVGNLNDVNLMVYGRYHCCDACIEHHVASLDEGIELIFSFKIKAGRASGRPGALEGPYPAQMSTRDYILRIYDKSKVYEIPQRSFRDILQNPAARDQPFDFFYRFEKTGGKSVRSLYAKDDTLLRQYEEGHVWRAG